METVHLAKFDGPLSLEERRTCETPPETQRVRVLLRESNVKDEGWRPRCFSASQMAAAKFLDTVSKLRGMAGEASDAISANHSTQNDRRSQIVMNAKRLMHVVIHYPAFSGKEEFKKCYLKRRGTKCQRGIVSTRRNKLGLFFLFTWTILKRLERSRTRIQCGQFSKKEIDLEDPTPLSAQMHLGSTQREAKVDPQPVKSNTELFENDDQGS